MTAPLPPHIRSKIPARINISDITFLGRALDFIELYDFPTEILLDCVRHPDEVAIDPHAMEVGYPILRFRRGDITVVLGLQRPQEPAITFVYLHVPNDDIPQHKGMGGAGGVGGKVPKSPQQLVGWAQAQGCQVAFNGRGHWNISYNGVLLGSTGGTVHSRSVMNDYSFLRKRLAAEKAKQNLSHRKKDTP